MYVAAIALAALAVLPWSADSPASALVLAFAGSSEKWPRFGATISLAPLFVAAAAVLVCAWRGAARGAALAAAVGLAWGIAQGFVAGVNGPAFGAGAVLALSAFTIALARGLARLGYFGGDATIATIVVTIAALLGVFVFFPVSSA